MAKGTKRVHPFQEWLSSEVWRGWKSIGLTGLKGSSKAYCLSLWREKIRGPFLVVVPRLEDADSLLEDLLFSRKVKRPLPFSSLRGKPSPMMEFLPIQRSFARG